MTHEELKKRLKYNPETGEFLRVLKDGTLKPTGHQLSAQGYYRIGVGQEVYLAHRLAWFYHYGVWPKQRIDHKNEVRTDNRIDNLRDVSASENGFNSSKTHGYTYHSRNRKWVAQIMFKRQHNYIGSFANEEDARMAYLCTLDFLRLEEGSY